MLSCTYLLDGTVCWWRWGRSQHRNSTTWGRLSLASLCHEVLVRLSSCCSWYPLLHWSLPAGWVCRFGGHPSQERCVPRRKRVLCLIVAGKSGCVCTDDWHIGKGWVGNGVSSAARSLVLGGLVAAYTAKSWWPVLHHVMVYSVFVCCLSPPEECVSSFWFHNRTFLGEPGLTEGGNVSLLFTKFPRDEGGPPIGLRRGIPVQEGAHVPCAKDHLFCSWFLPLLSVKPPAMEGYVHVVKIQ